MKVFKALWLVSAVLLSGCGSEFDGSYMGSTGFMLGAVMQLNGGRPELKRSMSCAEKWSLRVSLRPRYGLES
jgi:hypothetical protein